MQMSTTKPTPKQPAKLGTAGRELWQVMTGKYGFGPAELAVLSAACRQADDVARLEKLIDDDGVIVTGSAGQPRLSAALTEVRHGRLALAKLIGELAVPDDEGLPQTQKSRTAQKAANARWARVRQIEERRADGVSASA